MIISAGPDGKLLGATFEDDNLVLSASQKVYFKDRLIAEKKYIDADQDSILVVGTLTDLEGRFTISMLDSGNYYVEISERNFGKKQIYPLVITENIPKINMGEILLLRLPRKSPKLFSRKAKTESKTNQQVILAHEK